MKILHNWWLRYALALLVLFSAHLWYAGYFVSLPLSEVPSNWSDQGLESVLSRAWQGQPADTNSPSWLASRGLCWATGYRDGYQQVHELSLTSSRQQALTTILKDPKWKELEAVEVGLATNTTTYNRELLEREKTGLWGLLLRCSNGDLLLSPSDFPRFNQFPDGQSTKYLGERLVWRQAKFQSSLWLLRRDRGYKPEKILRGDTIVERTTLEPQQVQIWAQLSADYLLRTAQTQQGLLPSSYSLATGQFSENERNLLKICWGSLSLANYAKLNSHESVRLGSQRHLQATIARYGHSNELGAFVADGAKAPLGAQALFALALQLQPNPTPSMVTFRNGLYQTILACRKDDGHFEHKISVPDYVADPPQALADRNLPLPDPDKPATPFDDPQNDQPAMALLALRARPDLLTPQNFEASRRFYLDRFRRKPSRNSVPWLALLFENSPEELFFLVDWNLDNLAPWESTEPQLRGGVFNPDRLQYGPSCLSADVGAQLHALVIAERRADALRDAKRQERYRTSIEFLSRYLRQMQVRHSNDLYWLPHKNRNLPVGGLRNATWGSLMDVDSSASALWAWTLWLECHPLGSRERTSRAPNP